MSTQGTPFWDPFWATLSPLGSHGRLGRGPKRGPLWGTGPGLFEAENDGRVFKIIALGLPAGAKKRTPIWDPLRDGRLLITIFLGQMGGSQVELVLGSENGIRGGPQEGPHVGRGISDVAKIHFSEPPQKLSLGASKTSLRRPPALGRRGGSKIVILSPLGVIQRGVVVSHSSLP